MSEPWPCPHCQHSYPEQPTFLQCTKCGLVFDYLPSEPMKFKEKPMTIELGGTYKDKVSGWVGVATARYEYMNGCVRYELNSADKDGQPKGYVFDEEQITDVGDDSPVVPSKIKSGGDRRSAPVPR